MFQPRRRVQCPSLAGVRPMAASEGPGRSGKAAWAWKPILCKRQLGMAKGMHIVMRHHAMGGDGRTLLTVNTATCPRPAILCP